MEGTSIAIEIDGEAVCLDSVGENEQEAQEDGEMQQIMYAAENEEQVAFYNQEQGREEDPAGNEKEDRGHNSNYGTVAYSEEEAYRLYCDYGHRMGFSVRKGNQYYFTGTKTIRTKDYYCSKECLKDDEQLTEANFNKPETRTNCKAMVRFRVDSEEQVRTLSVPKPGVLNAMVNAEIQAMHDSLHINEDGTECHSQLSIRGYTQLEPDDLKFDTSYRTTKYNMICAMFIGVNHHRQNVIFGCAFLMNESSTSYGWLFKSFLESMGGRPPKTIFTDQNEFISKAIEDVFPGTRHCLCQCFIEKNLLSHLGTINDPGTFHSMLSKCMRGCESEAEFNEAWAMMHHECSMQENQWLTDLYQQRHKWCTALHKDAFDGGIELMVKSEVVNHSRILQHAAEVYTHKICNATTYQEAQCDEALFRVWVVFLNTSTLELSCSCKKFETIPTLIEFLKGNILKRWTKYARKGTYPFPIDEFAEQDRTEAASVYRNRAMYTRKLIRNVLENGEKSLESVCELKRLHIHPLGKEKDGSRAEKRKNQLSKRNIQLTPLSFCIQPCFSTD
ncbi:hypothetical protein BS78_08G032700 [Paspalum vaginatum]|nr:hypothetical protein BS78_08G032700 [Paspalum vaginatum]